MLTSLRIMGSSFIHLIRTDSNEVIFHGSYVPQLIHSSADGHLGCFHVLAIINKCSGLVYWEDPEGSGGEGGGRGDWDGEYM